MPGLHYLALVAGLATASADTTQYETAALRQLIQEAAVENRRVPDELGGYTAELESEISMGNRRSEGVEMAAQLEQVASTLRWDRTGVYEQTVHGYRSQSLGFGFASLGFFRGGWAIPSLYGNRLALLFGRDTTEAARRRRDRRGGEPLFAVHPLADDRDAYYRFSGGDTIITMRVEGREIPIVRVTVALREDVPARSVVFVGELDLDAVRNQLVRLRGHFAVVGGEKPRFDLLRDVRLQGIAFVEAVNAEINGSFWLPAYQRFEAHATVGAIGDSRAILRIITRYRDREFHPPPPGVVVGAPGDSLVARPFGLTVNHPDSLSAFSDWRRDLGQESAEVSAEDFADVSPDRWRVTGQPRLSLEAERLQDVVRLDRVQGVFTGLGTVLRLRDAAPGLTFRAAAGYAWSESTVRGRVVAEYRRGRTLTALRAARSLDLTNDFRNPYDSGSSIAALFGQDDYDYVDRRSASALLTRFLGAGPEGALRLEAGYVEDRGATAVLNRSPLGFGQRYRENRPVQEGRYVRTAALLEWRPDVTLEFLRTGVGARVSYERGDGELTYSRTEARFTVRSNRGPFALGARVDAGIVSPTAPPQQFLELGQSQNLLGYGYKEFAGDQAAVARAQVQWRSGLWGAPIRLTDRLWLPAAAPALSLGLQAGFTRASTAAAAAAVTALGSTTTGHVRSSGSFTLRFFGQAVGVGVARPLDYPGRWRWVLEFGQQP